MLNIKKVLLPLDLEESSFPVAVVRQAAALARHFHSEIRVLHVVRPLTFLAGSAAAREMLDQEIAAEDDAWKKNLGSELDGITVSRKVVHGDPADEIISMADEEAVGLIVMPTHSYSAYQRFLLGSVTAKVIYQTKCPVWTVPHFDETPNKQLAIHNVLCAVDLTEHSERTIQFAQDIAKEFGAQLTLAHATPGVEIYGPGGYHPIPKMKEELVGAAKDRFAEIQRKVGTNLPVFIGSGDVAKVMNQAAAATKADLLVIGSRYQSSGLGNVGTSIIRSARLPVLSA